MSTNFNIENCEPTTRQLAARIHAHFVPQQEQDGQHQLPRKMGGEVFKAGL